MRNQLKIRKEKVSRWNFQRLQHVFGNSEQHCKHVPEINISPLNDFADLYKWKMKTKYFQTLRPASIHSYIYACTCTLTNTDTEAG